MPNDDESNIFFTLGKREIKFCDVTSPNVLLDNDDKPLFDVAIASLVFDVVATDKDDFAKFLTNVANIVKPGDDSIKINSTCKLQVATHN